MHLFCERYTIYTYFDAAKQKETLKQAEATERSARGKLKDIQQKMVDSKSHHERELKEAEEAITKAKKEAESVVGEAKTREQEMQALRLEVEELEKSLETLQGQVGTSTYFCMNFCPCVCVCLSVCHSAFLLTNVQLHAKVCWAVN